MTGRAEFFIKGHPLRATPYHLRGVGLPGIYLLNGVTIENDADYGELVTIEDHEGLFRAIGLHIIERQGPIGGAELRWLRKQMGLTQTEFGQRIRISDQSVANAEKGLRALSAPADALARSCYLLHVLPPDSQVKLLRSLLVQIETLKVPEPQRGEIVGSWCEHAMPLAA